MRTPRFRNASSRRRCASVSKLNSVVLKTSGSGVKRTDVPRRSVPSPTASGFTTSPRTNPIRWTCPSRQTSTSRCDDSALTTDTPTPCRPPETLYVFWSNLPPACSTVITTSTVDLPACLCISTGMPRPSSSTRQLPSPKSVTVTFLQKPAIASSIELSTTSYTRWCRPSAEVCGMYRPGRFRTAERPSRILIASAPYSAAAGSLGRSALTGPRSEDTQTEAKLPDAPRRVFGAEAREHLGRAEARELREQRRAAHFHGQH